MPLSALFDGERHVLMPGEHFGLDTQYVQAVSLDEVEEEVEPLPYETPQMASELVVLDEEHPESQQHAVMAVAMSRLCHILDGKREQYQHNQYDGTGSKLLETSYTFRFEAEEDGWTGERF